MKYFFYYCVLLRTLPAFAANHSGCIDYPWAPSFQETTEESSSSTNLEVLSIFESEGIKFDSIHDLKSCSVFTEIPQLCAFYGDELFGASFLYPNEACCACGGGRNLTSPQQTCQDKPDNWTDPFGRNCEYYTSNHLAVNRWGLSSEEIDSRYCTDVLDSPSANDECCVCGGGNDGDGFNSNQTVVAIPNTTGIIFDESIVEIAKQYTLDVEDIRSCLDVNIWQDAFTEEGCPWYEKNLTEIFPNDEAMRKYAEEGVGPCYFFGEKGFNNGYSATDACCICTMGPDLNNAQGGIQNTTVVVKSELTSLPLRPVEPYDACIDQPGWKFINYVCTDFRVENGTMGITCQRYGMLSGEDGSSVNEACCVCGGGYSGLNIGRRFRVGYAKISYDLPYTYYVENGTLLGSSKGSVSTFLNDVAEWGGFGYYAVPTSRFSVDAYENNSLLACYSDVTIGFIDFCAAPMREQLGSSAKRTDALFTESFYLVVPEGDLNLFDYMITPFLPFNYEAWIAIFGMVLFMCIAMSIMSQTSSTSGKKQSIMAESGDIMFSTIQSFTSGAFDSPPDEPTKAQKIVIAGFGFSMLIILTAYTATSAAALLTNTPLAYNSIDDVARSKSARLCVQSDIKDRLLEAFPKVYANIQTKDLTALNLLKTTSYSSSSECDASVLSQQAYDSVVSYDPSLCSQATILLDQVLFSVDVVIYVSAGLNEYAVDLVDLINTKIRSGKFDHRNDDSRDVFLDNYTGSCNKVSDSNSAFVQLDLRELLAPILCSIVCSSIGLMLYSQKASIRRRNKRRLGLNLSTDDSDILLYEDLNRLNLFELVKICSSSPNIDEKDFKVAMDLLPDKEALIGLCFAAQSSQKKRDYQFVYDTFGVYELYQMLCYFEMHGQEVNNAGNPKKITKYQNLLPDEISKAYLVKELMSDPQFYTWSLQLADTKTRMESEGLDFAVEEKITLIDDGVLKKYVKNREKIFSKDVERFSLAALPSIVN